MTRRVFWIAIPVLLLTTAGTREPIPLPLPDEELAGGETTVFDSGHGAFGRSLRNLERRRWSVMRSGKRLFESPWQAPGEDAALPRQGLGPLFNAVACTDCHFRDGRGGPPEIGESTPTMAPAILRWVTATGGPDPTYGYQLNDRSVGVAAEGSFALQRISAQPAGLEADFGLSRVHAEVSALRHGPLHADTQASVRIPPFLIGLGLLEAVADETLEALADPHDFDGDGVSGRVQRVPDASGGTRLGRFGWKASQADLKSQVARAFLEDLGVTSSLHPEQNCPPQTANDSTRQCQRKSEKIVKGAELDAVELSDYQLELVTLYVRLLAPPARRDWQEPEVLKGREVFGAVGCSACHTPELVTASHGSGPDSLPELSGQTIRPFTDLLLHDMGPDLADGVAEHGASPAEWRTAPLWGLGLQQRVNGNISLLHDGRAASVTEAILWHGGEATDSRQRFVELSPQHRQALLRFLKSL